MTKKMPQYTFICNNCEHLFTESLGMLDSRSDVECPECLTSNVRRYIGSSVPVHYNGDGFTTNVIPKRSGLEGYVS